MGKLEVGQELWYVPQGSLYHDTGAQRTVTVEKLGRRWSLLSGMAGCRMDLESLYVECAGYVVGRCYQSRDSYLEAAATEKRWRQLHAVIGNVWDPTKGVTREDIDAAAALLRVSIWMEGKD